MLLEISVENFGIIDHIRWRPTSGLNIITGETGAGKSLIIDAIEALVGKRVGEEVVRAGSDHARIEGVFNLNENSILRELLAEYGCGCEDAIILTREIRGKGGTLNRVNGRTVPLRLLQEAGRVLIDIHGQSDHISLNEPYQQLLLLDHYANVKDIRSEVEAKVEKLYKLEKELKNLIEDEREIVHRTDLLNYQVNEIRSAGVHDAEDEELQKDIAVLSNVEKLKSLSQAAYQALYGTDVALPSAIDRVGEAVRVLKELVQADVNMGNLLREVESVLYQIEDMSQALSSYKDELEYDPARLDQLEQRLDLIRNLKRKYGDTIADILQYANKAEEELNQLSFQGERKAQLQRECATLREDIGALSCELSKIRHRAAEELAKEVEQELSHLNMAQVGFQVIFSQLETADKLVLPDGSTHAFSKNGIDRVEFLISINPGEPFKPLAKIASTGETSRLMLAIKSALSKADATPTLIFDEIDIGIGGRSGEIVGKKLSNLSKDHQVICITHLPQVAVFADEHYSVHKDVHEDRTTTMVALLSGKARLEEISAMLGSLSEPSLESSQELLGKAEAWKRSQLDSSHSTSFEGQIKRLL